MNIFPTPYVYFRNRTTTVLPATLLPSDCNPSDMGVQLSSVPIWLMYGTATLEFAIIGKGPQKVPVSSVTTDNPWSLQGAEVRVYFDTRVDKTLPFDPLGTTTGTDANGDPTYVKLVFVGDIHEIRPVASGNTQWFAYSCAARSLVSRAERISVVSPINNSDIARFNMNALKSDYEPQVSGRTIGEALLLLLEDYGTAYRMDQAGIGKYTIDNVNESATLPIQTRDDISKLTLITPFEFRVTGDNIIAGITQTLDQYCPNYQMVILPDGMIRILDVRQVNSYAIDLSGDKPIGNFSLTKSTMASYSKVVVQGGPKIVPYYCQWNLARVAGTDNSGDAEKINGNLTEFFDYTGKSNLAAKQAFQWSDYTFSRILLSKGTVSFKDSSNVDLQSNQVRLIPSSASTVDGTNPNLKVWGENELTIVDSSIYNRRDCRLTVNRKIILTGNATANIPTANTTVSYLSGTFLPTQNTAVVNNSSVVTTSPNVDRTPSYYQIGTAPGQYQVEYTYELHGWKPSGAVSWRRYKVTLDSKPTAEPNTRMTRKLATFFTQPAIDLWYSNVASEYRTESRTWLPRCLVEYKYPAGTGWSYGSFFCGFRIDQFNRLIVLDRPSAIESTPSGTYADVGPPWDATQTFKYVPYNIKAVLPVYDGRYEATYPADGAVDANGTLIQAVVKSSYGIDRTLTVGLSEWQDGRDQAYADVYAKEIWDAVQQPQAEGGFIWVTGYSSEWNPYGITDVEDTVTTRKKPKIQGFKITNSSTCNSTDGSGIEDCTLFATSVTVKFANDHMPMTEVAFATAKPRFGAAMHDFHSFEESLQRDGIVANSYSANQFVGAVFQG